MPPQPRTGTVFRTKRELLQHIIRSSDSVLDLGFFGQGLTESSPNWGHRLIVSRAKEVYGLDVLPYSPPDKARVSNYKVGTAESFDFGRQFDLIFAGDLIEHLSNIGLFLDCCKKALVPNGRLVITTPNCFGLSTVIEKAIKDEPTVNADHTCYLNKKTIAQLLGKNGWKVMEFEAIYSLETEYKQSLKKKGVNMLYWILSLFTNKYLETMVVTAVPVGVGG